MSVLFAVLFCSALVGLDQLFKFLAIEYLKPIEYIDVINKVLRFRYVENTGAVFGSFATQTMLLTIFSVVLLVFTIVFLIKNKDKSKFVNVCLLLMIAGGIGNIIDRIRLKYVVDFIEPLFVDFAVFNFADCLITVGAFMLIGYLIVDILKDVKKSPKRMVALDKTDTDSSESNGTD